RSEEIETGADHASGLDACATAAGPKAAIATTSAKALRPQNLFNTTTSSFSDRHPRPGHPEKGRQKRRTSKVWRSNQNAANPPKVRRDPVRVTFWPKNVPHQRPSEAG